MRATIRLNLIPALLGFSPVVLMLLTWAPDGAASRFAIASNELTLSVLVAEVFVILVAARKQMLLSAMCNEAVSPIALAAISGLFTTAIVTAALVSPVPGAAFARTAIWIIHGLFGFSVMQLCDTEFKRETMTTAFMIGFVCFAAGLVVFVLRIPDPGKFDWVSGWPAVTHIRHLGYYAAAVIGLCIGRFAATAVRNHWKGTLPVATIAFTLAFWTGTRGAVAAAGAGFVAGMLLFPAMRRWQVWLGTLGSGVLSAGLVATLPVPAAHMGLYRSIAASVGANGSIDTGRTHVWWRTLNAIYERPLFGYGDGQMFSVVGLSYAVQPHNVLLQTLLAWGVVGTVCIVILAVPFAIRTVRGVRSLSGERLPPVLAMLVLAAYSTFDGTLYYVLPVSIFAACVGLVAREGQVRQPSMMSSK